MATLKPQFKACRNRRGQAFMRHFCTISSPMGKNVEHFNIQSVFFKPCNGLPCFRRSRGYEVSRTFTRAAFRSRQPEEMNGALIRI
jgi:hypothetical protein